MLASVLLVVSASTGGLGMYPPQVRGDYCTLLINSKSQQLVNSTACQSSVLPGPVSPLVPARIKHYDFLKICGRMAFMTKTKQH